MFLRCGFTGVAHYWLNWAGCGLGTSATDTTGSLKSLRHHEPKMQQDFKASVSSKEKVPVSRRFGRVKFLQGLREET